MMWCAPTPSWRSIGAFDWMWISRCFLARVWGAMWAYAPSTRLEPLLRQARREPMEMCPCGAMRWHLATPADPDRHHQGEQAPAQEACGRDRWCCSLPRVVDRGQRQTEDPGMASRRWGKQSGVGAVCGNMACDLRRGCGPCSGMAVVSEESHRLCVMNHGARATPPVSQTAKCWRTRAGKNSKGRHTSKRGSSLLDRQVSSIRRSLPRKLENGWLPLPPHGEPESLKRWRRLERDFEQIIANFRARRDGT
jgi:hypothetical protein